MTEQDLTKKILRNAKQQANDLISAAEKRASEQIAAAQAQADERKKLALKQGQDSLEYRKTQQKRAHEVSCIKAQINAQQDWIEQAFTTAREKLLNASKQEIQTIVDAYTKKYAKPGDKILIAKNWAHAFPKLPTTTAINGGIIIENQTYRLELGIDNILAELREPLAPTVAEILGVL